MKPKISNYPHGGPMIGWLCRWIYRREIRERQERAAAQVEVWRQRQVENDARWDAVTAELERAKQLPPDEFLAWAERFSAGTRAAWSGIRMEDT